MIAFGLVGCSNNDRSVSGNDYSAGDVTGIVTGSSSVFEASIFKVASMNKGGKTLDRISYAAASGTVPVPGATCTVEGTDKSDMTDENGRFSIHGVSPGSHIIICKKTMEDGSTYALLKIIDVRTGETFDIGTVWITLAGKIQGTATLAGRSDSSGVKVYIPGTAIQATTGASGAYQITNVPEGTCELRFEKDGYTTAILPEIAVIAGQTHGASDVILNISTGASGSILIANGTRYSKSREVTLSITASSNATLMMISEDPFFINAVWEPVSPTAPYTFDSDGQKRLYIRFANANGLESAPVTDEIIIDTASPTDASISINGGASTTSSNSVTLAVSATDPGTGVSQMMISDSPDFSGAAWQIFSASLTWTLSPGDGSKTVYAKFKDHAGNEAATAVSASILLASGILAPADCVAADKAALTIGYGSGDFENHVTQNLILPSAGANGTSISWSSSNTTAIYNNGTVTRPDNGSGDAVVTLTATITKDTAQDIRQFTLLVKEKASLTLIGGSIRGTGLTLTNTVSTFAGSLFEVGSTDEVGMDARFKEPHGITTDGTNLFVADEYNHAVRKIVISTAAVTTIAGTALSAGSTDGPGSSARFFNPRGITTDGTRLYIADYMNNTIRAIVISTGVVSTLAGSPGTQGTEDGLGSAARFNGPIAVTTDGANLYVSDNNSTIRKIVIATGAVSTIAGTAGIMGTADGIGAAARFYSPYGITTDGTYLYVVDRGNATIRKIVIATGEVTTIAGVAGNHESVDGIGTGALFFDPFGITSDGTSLYITDWADHIIRKINISTGKVTTIAGQAGIAGYADGNGPEARFYGPQDVTTDGQSLYVVNTEGSTIRKID